MNLNATLARNALDARAALEAEARTVNADATLTPAQRRERVERINADIAAKTAEARTYVEQGEREAALSADSRGAALLGAGARAAGPEWGSLFPSASEHRAAFAEGTPADGGYSVPIEVRDQAIRQLRARSVFLNAPGLNILPMESMTLALPAIGSWSDATVTGENANISLGSQSLTLPMITAIKFSDLRSASNEILSDSALGLRRIIADESVRNIAQAVDRQAFGSGNGTTALKGLANAGQATATNLSSGNTVIRFNHIIDAYSAIVAAGGSPSVIWCSSDVYPDLIKEREQYVSPTQTQGAPLVGDYGSSPLQTVLGLPLLPSANLPVKTLYVADASRVFVGLRQDVQIAVSEHVGFTSDSVYFRATFRLGGVVVAEPSSVQRITAASA